jgi:hypothetical protein
MLAMEPSVSMCSVAQFQRGRWLPAFRASASVTFSGLTRRANTLARGRTLAQVTTLTNQFSSASGNSKPSLLQA